MPQRPLHSLSPRTGPCRWMWRSVLHPPPTQSLHVGRDLERWRVPVADSVSRQLQWFADGDAAAGAAPASRRVSATKRLRSGLYAVLSRLDQCGPKRSRFLPDFTGAISALHAALGVLPFRGLWLRRLFRGTAVLAVRLAVQLSVTITFRPF